MTFILLIWALVDTSTALGRQSIPYQQILDYQLGKSSIGPSPETLFIGDSSLGNAISPDLWQSMSGQTTQSLALTGLFGHTGSHSMLLRTLRHGRPRNVIIMQSAGILRLRPRNAERLRWLMEHTEEIGLLQRWKRRWQTVMNLQELNAVYRWMNRRLKAVLNIGNARERLKGKEIVFVDDYMRQGAKKPQHDKIEGWKPYSIRQAHIDTLTELALECRRHSLNCIYIFGPMAEPNCSRSRAYFERASALIQKTGINLIGNLPVCMRGPEIGDTINHVDPNFKRNFTRKYFNIVKLHLR